MEEYGTDYSYVITHGKLNTCLEQSVLVSQKLKNVHAKPHLIRGVSRRFQMILFSFFRINTIASPDRDKPLQKEEHCELNIHLNSIYIHIHGVLDNLAWGYCHETKILGELKDINERDPNTRRQVGLFTDCFTKAIKVDSVNLSKILENNKMWFLELRNFRDPVAHRLPLYAIPSILSEEEAQEYMKKSQGLFIKLNGGEGELDKTGTLVHKLGQMGTYVPCFYHEQQDNSRSVPIMIQIEQDINHLCCITTAVIDALGKWGDTSPIY